MIQSVNRRQSLEMVLTLLMTLAFILNINSVMSGVGQTANQLQLGSHADNAIGSLANVGDEIQSVTEGGVVQTLVGVVTGGSNLASSATEVPVQTTQESSQGNIGAWIDQSGTWALSLFTPSETSPTGQFATSLGHTIGTIPAPMQQAGSGFDHLSRPLIANVPLKEKVINELKELHTTMATMISVW